VHKLLCSHVHKMRNDQARRENRVAKTSAFDGSNWSDSSVIDSKIIEVRSKAPLCKRSSPESNHHVRFFEWNSSFLIMISLAHLFGVLGNSPSLVFYIETFDVFFFFFSLIFLLVYFSGNIMSGLLYLSPTYVISFNLLVLYFLISNSN